MEPTWEQIKEFWEKIGLPYSGYGNAKREKAKNLPPIDLNNLFKYAVPKVIDNNDYFRLFYDRSNQRWDCQAGLNLTSHKDPTLALFWAISEVLKEA